VVAVANGRARRAVAVANGGVLADVGAVLGDDVRALVSAEGEASAGREGRSSGRGFCL
jgi:hypothetical protein